MNKNEFKLPKFIIKEWVTSFSVPKITFLENTQVTRPLWEIAEYKFKMGNWILCYVNNYYGDKDLWPDIITEKEMTAIKLGILDPRK